MLPLCQGQYGSQKNTLTSVATVNLACWVSSDPRSQVSDRRKATGSSRTAFISASTTTSVRFSRNLTRTTNRDCRSTSVAMKVPREPSTRSPSQCPGTARSSASAGLSRMGTAPRIRSPVRPSDAQWGRRIRGPERRWPSNSFLGRREPERRTAVNCRWRWRQNLPAECGGL